MQTKNLGFNRMRSTRAFGVFIVGLVAGILLTIYVLVLPRDSQAGAQAIPTLAPTPPLPNESVLAQLDALDQVIVNLYQRVSPSVLHIASHQEVDTFFYGV